MPLHRAEPAAQLLLSVPQLNCSQYRSSTLKDGRQLMACTMIYSPVCGTDGVTYASECTLCAHNL